MFWELGFLIFLVTVFKKSVYLGLKKKAQELTSQLWSSQETDVWGNTKWNFGRVIYILEEALKYTRKYIVQPLQFIYLEVLSRYLRVPSPWSSERVLKKAMRQFEDSMKIEWGVNKYHRWMIMYLKAYKKQKPTNSILFQRLISDKNGLELLLFVFYPFVFYKIGFFFTPCPLS